MKNITKFEKAYKEIIEVLNKYKDICVYDISDMESKAKKHLFGIELKEKYGFNVEPKDIYSCDWVNLGDYKSIGWFGEKYRRTISWSVDGKQPEDELLLDIGFSTGAYIFGDDYPKELFQKFWLELKSYKPKYCDEVNNHLYFDIKSASKIFNEFGEILKKYNEINKKDHILRQIKKNKEELKKLKTEL